MQHDLQILILAAVLVAAVTYTPWLRVPLGLLLALVSYAAIINIGWLALAGAAGMTAACLAIALTARAGRDQYARSDEAARQRRDQLRDQFAKSPAFAKLTFMAGAAPVLPPRYLFSLLGSMRAPLIPALFGVLISRFPLLLITTLFFSGIADFATDTDHQATLLLGALGLMLVIIRTINAVDWQHRAETGNWRMTDEASGGMTSNMFGGMHVSGDAPDQSLFHSPRIDQTPPEFDTDDDDDIVEAEVLGEEIDEDH